MAQPVNSQNATAVNITPRGTLTAATLGVPVTALPFPEAGVKVTVALVSKGLDAEPFPVRVISCMPNFLAVCAA